MAFPGTYNFSYYRGDTLEFIVRPRQSNGSSFSLTEYTAQFVIANRRGVTGTQYPATAVVNTTSNIVTCTITPTVGRELAPGSYFYDVEITDGIKIYTLLTGSITVTDDITGATA